MSKKVVDGIEISDDTPVSEYDGKFSGSFELEVEKAAAMAYDDEITFVVTARLDNYSFKPTKYGDLKRTNVFKVDHVGLISGNKTVVEVHNHNYQQPEFPENAENIIEEDYDEVIIPAFQVETKPRHYGDMQEDIAQADGGRDYKDPLLRRFLEEL
jgi:hypothetical protein